MGFSRQEYWSELPFPSPGDLSDPGIEPMSPVSPALQADSLGAMRGGLRLIHWKCLIGTLEMYSQLWCLKLS